MLGLLASCGLIAVMEIVDDRIRSEDYLLQNFGTTPLLAVIPDMVDDKSKGQYYNSYYGHYYGYGHYGKSKKKSKKNAVRRNEANDKQRRA